MRAIIVGELVVSIGGILPPLTIIANLRTTPRVPWMLLITALWLWLFWWYLQGRGWPQQTTDFRRRDLRGDSLPARVWGWALLAGALGIASTLALGFATLRVANVSREAFAAPVNFSSYPSLTVICAIACISATAGVVEEAGFRGFHAFTDSTPTWMDGGHSYHRIHVLSRPSFQSRLCDVCVSSIFSRDQRGAWVAGQV